MIPILFDGKATDFTTNGIGRLTECISCIVTEERNGIYDLEMVYPKWGSHFEDVKVSNIIVVDTSDTIKRQAFEIYYISKPINNIVTIRANHISYRMSYIPVKPFIATGITDTLNGLNTNALETSQFTFWTDIDNTVTTYNQVFPKSMRSSLGGTNGSILDVFSGSGGVEFEWDNFLVKVYRNRGTDNGVQLRKAKNITDLTQDETIENTVTGVVPMWTNSDNTVVLYGDIQYSQYKSNYPINRTVVMDLSSEFENVPTKIELNNAGAKYIADQGLPETNLKISFLSLADANMYENIGILETVNLCDTITVIDKQLNISYKAKVIKTTRDVLKNRYNSIEIGDAKSNMAKTVADNLGDIHSLQLANNKLVSVTQTLDREIGKVQTTVATVETDISDLRDDVDGDISNLQTQITKNASDITQTATSINQSVTQQIATLRNDINGELSDLRDDIDGDITNLQSQITQTASSITTIVQSQINNSNLVTSSQLEQTVSGINITITDVQEIIGEQGNTLRQYNEYFHFTNNGLEIYKQGDRVHAIYGNNEMRFVDGSNNKLAWINASDGMGALQKVSIAQNATTTNRWQWLVSSDGTHSRFTRHN